MAILAKLAVNKRTARNKRPDFIRLARSRIVLLVRVLDNLFQRGTHCLKEESVKPPFLKLSLKKLTALLPNMRGNSLFLVLNILKDLSKLKLPIFLKLIFYKIPPTTKMH